MLNVIDISSHQGDNGIVASRTPADVVIIKVSGGTSYVNPYWRSMAEDVLKSGKLLGFYQYACEYGSEPGGRAEAEFFWNLVKEYKGKFVPILDWENHAWDMPVSYAKAFLDRIAELSGATPMFYGGASDVNNKDYSSISKYPLWMASYLYRYDGSGFVVSPVNTWATGSWGDMTMYQYTSTGRIPGYDGPLDLSCFYGTKEDWKRLCGGETMANKIETMCKEAVAIANDDSHGYSQAVRWLPDFDCSSLMYYVADKAGFGVGRGPEKTRYTGTMPSDFKAAGFTMYDRGAVEPYRGCILLWDPWGDGGHTELCIGGNKAVGAHCSETGGIYGQAGDQTGNEISVAWMRNDYDFVLCPPAEKDEPVQKPGKTVNDEGLKYRAHVQNLGWCPWVRDGQCAGTTGFSLRGEAIEIEPPEGVEIECSAHIQDIGWKCYGVAKHGAPLVVGTTSKALRMEALMLRATKMPKGKKLQFQVHQVDTGWKAWTDSGFASGSDGLRKRLEAFRLKIVKA